MSIGDMLKGALGQIEAAAVPAILNEVLSKTDVGGLQGIVQKLQATGFGPQVQSWLGNGTNMPITADQLRDALNSDQVRQIASPFRRQCRRGPEDPCPASSHGSWSSEPQW